MRKNPQFQYFLVSWWCFPVEIVPPSCVPLGVVAHGRTSHHHHHHRSLELGASTVPGHLRHLGGPTPRVGPTRALAPAGKPPPTSPPL